MEVFLLFNILNFHNSYGCNDQWYIKYKQENREQPQAHSLGKNTEDSRNAGTSDVSTYLFGTHNGFRIFLSKVAWS